MTLSIAKYVYRLGNDTVSISVNITPWIYCDKIYHTTWCIRSFEFCDVTNSCKLADTPRTGPRLEVAPERLIIQHFQHANNLVPLVPDIF